jgi:alginate O-acetyltransferase complex protein AlgI
LAGEGKRVAKRLPITIGPLFLNLPSLPHRYLFQGRLKGGMPHARGPERVMVFSSAVFLFLFLPLLLAVHHFCPRRLRNPLLLTASLFFYLWGEKGYVLVLLASIALNYVMGLWLDRLSSQRGRRLVIAAAIAGNLGLLAFYKYGVFVVENLNEARAVLHLAPMAVPRIHLPLGISFFTFHALSYVVDVYRREARPLTNPITFALYLSFFPQSIAGPIVRFGDVAGQLGQRTIRVEAFAEGVRRFVFGLAKKMLIANTLAGPADALFGRPAESLTAGMAWLGLVCYTLQIYFDFSGYSDMAVGLARMFGFTFPENFNYPYVSRSVAEFWRRWHVSLSSWFRDYLYVPLGGNRCGTRRTYFNLLTVFFLCGLWHGASWAFVCWGLYHGAFLVLERGKLGRLLERAATPIRRAYVLLVVMIGWVFFRAPTLTQALAYLAALAGLGTAGEAGYGLSVHLSADVVLALAAGILVSMPLLAWLQRLGASSLGLAPRRPMLAPLLQAAFAGVSVATQAALLLASVATLAAGTHNPFIYFRF